MGNQACCQTKNIEQENSQTALPFAAREKSIGPRKEQASPGLSPIGRAIEREKESSLVSEKYESMQEDCLNAVFKEEQISPEVTEFLQQLPSINSIEPDQSKFAGIELRPSKTPFVIPQVFAVALEGYKLRLLNCYKFYKEIKESGRAFSCQYKVRFFGTLENGSVNGYGQILVEGSYFYEGEIKQNLPDGFGLFFYSPEVVYYGEFAKGRREGQGILELSGRKTWAEKLRGQVAGRPRRRRGGRVYGKRRRLRGRIPEGQTAGQRNDRVRGRLGF